MAAEGSGLTDYATALQTVLDHASPGPAEQVSLRAALGRVLAETVVAGHAMPFFDNSAMDGYAICAEDAARVGAEGSRHLRLNGMVRAGEDPGALLVLPGTTVRVYTGAALPGGAYAILPQEDVGVDGDQVTIRGPVRPGQHIRRRGEELQPGETVARAGTVMGPGAVAALAASGAGSATVSMRPAVGLLVTGDELVEPGVPLPPGCIYESNSYGIEAALAEMGYPVEIRRISDDERATRTALHELLDACDVVLTSGGVSVGDYDRVKPAARELGVETVLWGVAIKPGKPFYFGLLRRDPTPAVLFGLPGNPVAAIVTLYVLVRPYLLRCEGLDGHPAVQKARLTASLRKQPGRMEFVPCRLDGADAEPVAKRGSHMPGTLVSTNALALFPAALEALEAGAVVDVMPMDWRHRQACR